jgi:hypothetical protein
MLNTIPSIDNILPYLQTPIDLDALYPGLAERQAYHAYLDENGYTIKGPRVFNIELIPSKAPERSRDRPRCRRSLVIDTLKYNDCHDDQNSIKRFHERRHEERR